MIKQEVIERLCRMTSQVGHLVFKDQYAYDCFCDLALKPEINNAHYQFDENIIQFIEASMCKAVFDITGVMPDLINSKT